MSIFISVVILILVALIQISMQLTPGIFILFYHYALGKKSRNKADDLSLSFILGAETFIATIWFLVLFTFLPIIPQVFIWVIASLLIIEATASLFFYYRKGPGTALFITRSSAKVLELRAKNIKTRSDAFILGFFSNLPELIFTFPLYLLASFIMPNISFSLPPAIYIIIYLMLAVMPLFFIHILYRTDHNLSDIERLRINLKPVVRLFLFVGFLLLAILTINYGVINNG